MSTKKIVTVGSFIREQLSKGSETDKILAAVAKRFPESSATAGDVSWNRWKMKKDAKVRKPRAKKAA